MAPGDVSWWTKGSFQGSLWAIGGATGDAKSANRGRITAASREAVGWDAEIAKTRTLVLENSSVIFYQ
jgi:hypothetical protein